MAGSTGDERMRALGQAVRREMRDAREEEDRELVDVVGDEHRRVRETVDERPAPDDDEER